MGMNPPRPPFPEIPQGSGVDHPTTRPPGVIETIADGMSLALSHPIVLLVPLLIDGGLWSGAAISPGSLLDRWNGPRRAAETLGFDGDIVRVAAIGSPSLLESVDRGDVFRAWPGIGFEPATWQSTLLALVGLGVASSVLAMAFRVPLAVVIRDETRTPREAIRSIGVAWVRFVGLIGLILGVTALVISPLLVIGAFLSVAGVDVVPLLTAVFSVPAIGAAIYLAFTPDAIVLSEVGPFRAMYLSFNVVRRNFWPTLGLLGTMLLISEGLGVLWRAQIETPIGLLIGVLGNAIVGAGLALAAMRFYSDRFDPPIPASSPHPFQPAP